jgi:hypothetical protein
LIDRYLAQAFVTSANSASMLEIGFRVGLEIRSFTAGYGQNEPRILCRISEIVRFGGLSGIAPPEALGSIGFPTISSMIFVSANSMICGIACRSRHWMNSAIWAEGPLET